MTDWSDIGEKLKESRENQGFSLEDVAHKTRIPLSFLKAIEANYYAVFSSPTYAKSFVQQYSAFLKFEADEWLENFKTGNVLSPSDRIEYLDQPKKQTQSIKVQPRQSSKEKAEPQNSLRQPLLILLITGGLVAAGVWAFFTVESRLNTSVPSLSDQQTQDIQKPANNSALPKNEVVVDKPKIAPFVFPEDDPPPRAIIVEDDEEVTAPKIVESNE